jgi:hypothetical protein
VKFACAGMFVAGGTRSDDVDYDDVGQCCMFDIVQGVAGWRRVVRGGVVAPDWIHQDFSAALGNGLFFLERGKETQRVYRFCVHSARACALMCYC